MNAPWEASLARAEFDFVETVVRYHEGKASAAEVGAARNRFRELGLRFERGLRPVKWWKLTSVLFPLLHVVGSHTGHLSRLSRRLDVV